MKITNIRLKSANKKSVKKLYFLEGIDAIEKIENNYEKKVFLVSILEGIRQYSTQNYKIECDFKKFHYRIFQYYRIIKRKLKETVKILMKNKYRRYQKFIINYAMLVIKIIILDKFWSILI